MAICYFHIKLHIFDSYSTVDVLPLVLTLPVWHTRLVHSTGYTSSLPGNQTEADGRPVTDKDSNHDTKGKIDGLMQKRCNSSASALELHLFCMKQLKCNDNKC